MKQNSKIGIIGLGRMGKCLAQGLLDAGTVQRDQIRFTTRHATTAAAVAAELGVASAENNRVLAKECATLVLAVKPQSVPEVLAEIGSAVGKRHTLVSIAASVSTAQILALIGSEAKVVRAMPNTPALVRAGITAISLGEGAGETAWETARSLFEPLGKVIRVDEKHLNAVTGLSGCGPAFVYVVLESLTDAGIKVGLPRDVATQLAAQTVMGAAKMLIETGRHPAALKDDVTTPAGCTIDGLMELEEGKLRVTLIKAVVQATLRARQLGGEPD